MTPRRTSFVQFLIFAMLLLAALPAQAQVSLTTPGSTSMQSFEPESTSPQNVDVQRVSR